MRSILVTHSLTHSLIYSFYSLIYSLIYSLTHSASFEVSNKLPAFNNEDPKVLLHKRFFSSIILFQLTQEYPIRQLADVMQIKRGQIQSLQKDAAVFCEMITTFCRKLNWNLLGSCLSTMHGRLNHGRTTTSTTYSLTLTHSYLLAYLLTLTHTLTPLPNHSLISFCTDRCAG